MDIHFWLREAWSQFWSTPALDEALLTWISPVSSCDGCLSHRPNPSPLTWYDGRWYRTTAHWLSDVSGGAPGRQRPWQTPLYSFNPKVLKQHLTQIEVGFVCCRGRGKITGGIYPGKLALSLLHVPLHLSVFFFYVCLFVFFLWADSAAWWSIGCYYF